MTSSPAQARGPYAKTAATRERILEASESVFADSGFGATTMKEVAARAQISERGLVHHFPNKEALLAAVLERHEQRTPLSDAPAPAAQALSQLVEQVQRDASRRGIVELHATLSAEASSAEHPAHDHYRLRYDSFRLYVTTIFDELAEAGALSSSLTPAELAASYIALSDGLQLQWLYNPDAVVPTRILQHFVDALIEPAS